MISCQRVLAFCIDPGKLTLQFEGLFQYFACYVLLLVYKIRTFDVRKMLCIASKGAWTILNEIQKIRSNFSARNKLNAISMAPMVCFTTGLTFGRKKQFFKWQQDRSSDMNSAAFRFWKYKLCPLNWWIILWHIQTVRSEFYYCSRIYIMAPTDNFDKNDAMIHLIFYFCRFIHYYGIVSSLVVLSISALFPKLLVYFCTLFVCNFVPILYRW